MSLVSRYLIMFAHSGWSARRRNILTPEIQRYFFQSLTVTHNVGSRLHFWNRPVVSESNCGTKFKFAMQLDVAKIGHCIKNAARRGDARPDFLWSEAHFLVLLRPLVDLEILQIKDSTANHEQAEFTSTIQTKMLHNRPSSAQLRGRLPCCATHCELSYLLQLIFFRNFTLSYDDGLFRIGRQ